MKKSITSIIFILLFSFYCSGQNINNWLEDIDYYQKTLEEKHINLYHTISKSEFNSEIKNLESRLHFLTDFQIIIELMRITQKIGGGQGDGHTAVPLWNKKLHKYPIELFDFNGEIRVIGIDEKYSQFLGSQLKSIDGVNINEIYKKVSKLTPFTENKQSIMDRTCSYLVISEILKALNVTKNINQAQFTFINEKDDKISISLKAINNEELEKIKFAAISYKHPKIAKPKDSKLKNLWFTSLNDSKTVYINFKEYGTIDEMQIFSKQVYNFIEENKSEHLIIDLRDNYGGDFYKGLLLSSYLNACDSINWESNVYVLINRKTYSAAMVNAIQFKQLLNAIVVGEPTGANSNGYQDLGQFGLPNSKLLITYTKRIFRLQEAKSNGLQPDIFITSKWENYKNGFDETLNWVLFDISGLD